MTRDEINATFLYDELQSWFSADEATRAAFAEMMSESSRYTTDELRAAWLYFMIGWTKALIQHTPDQNVAETMLICAKDVCSYCAGSARGMWSVAIPAQNNTDNWVHQQQGRQVICAASAIYRRLQERGRPMVCRDIWE